MGSPPENHDNGCLICGKAADQVPVGVYSEYTGEGARHGERVWICEGCAQVKEYARAFVVQARDHYTSYGGTWPENQPRTGLPYAYSYRIASPVLRAQVDQHGLNLFHAWTADL
jgi:hypothetical protein